MNKTISTASGILIVVLVAGVAGASVLMFGKESKDNLLSKEEEKEYMIKINFDEGETIGEDATEEWKTFFHHKYPYSMRYPVNWKVSRLELVYGLTDSYVFESLSGYFLVFGAVPIESNEKVGLRTGAQTGYLVEDNDTIMISGTEVEMKKLVGWGDDKVLELLFENFEINGYKGGGYIGYNKHDDNFDMIASEEVEMIKKILDDVVFEELD